MSLFGGGPLVHSYTTVCKDRTEAADLNPVLRMKSHMTTSLPPDTHHIVRYQRRRHSPTHSSILASGYRNPVGPGPPGMAWVGTLPVASMRYSPLPVELDLDLT